MPVANLADISPHLTHDNTVKLLAEAYNNRMDTNKVSVLFTHFTQTLSLLILLQ